MSKIWNYFTKSGGKAFCKHCNYSKDFPPQAPTTILISHLKIHHEPLHKQFEAEKNATKKEEPIRQKRNFFASSSGLDVISLNDSPNKENAGDAEGEPSSSKPKQMKIEQFGMKSVWEKDGARTVEINRAIVEFMATDIQPFSVVENCGFQRLMALVAPKYKLLCRKFFTENSLPAIYSEMKAKVKQDLAKSDWISLTVDAWSSRDSKHSLLSITAHFVDTKPRFVVLGAKPIKDRHIADNMRILIQSTLEEFQIEDKIFIILRDAASVMVKMCDDMGIKSLDCFAHKLNLCIGEGLKDLGSDADLKEIIERIKRFVRKLNKSSVQRQEFENIQKLIDLLKRSLIKATEVRWSSTFSMLERFLCNKQAIMLLCVRDAALPKFTGEDWAMISDLEKILSPIHKATEQIQKRTTTISTIIPWFRVLIHALEQDKSCLWNLKEKIINGLMKRMDEETNARGLIKREAWHNNKNLVLSTIMDPRFKLNNYLDPTRHDEYKNWLITEAIKMQEIEQSRPSFASSGSSTKSGGAVRDLFDDFLKASTEQDDFLAPLEPLPTTSELNARQRAEVEVTEYLKLKRLSIGDDPFLFWTGDYATKWPLLAKLARKYFSAPATSAESERLFSTAGQIITNLRSSLKDENVEKLLFLHHNIKIYDFNYV